MLIICNIQKRGTQGTRFDAIINTFEGVVKQFEICEIISPDEMPSVRAMRVAFTFD